MAPFSNLLRQITILTEYCIFKSNISRLTQMAMGWLIVSKVVKNNLRPPRYVVYPRRSTMMRSQSHPNHKKKQKGNLKKKIKNPHPVHRCLTRPGQRLRSKQQFPVTEAPRKSFSPWSESTHPLMCAMHYWNGPKEVQGVTANIRITLPRAEYKLWKWRIESGKQKFSACSGAAGVFRGI